MLDKKMIKPDNNRISNPKGMSLKKIFMVVILLAVMFLVAGLIVYLRPKLDKENANIAEDKNNILNQLELREKEGKPLSAEEKKEIFETLSDTKIQQFDFSKEEKIKILKALNN